MGYILKDKSKFLHDYFGFEDDADIIGCVVTKNNIRSTNKYVPVIDYEKTMNLISNYGVSSASFKIRNHEYEDELPENWELGNAEVHYSGFNFTIPAIVMTNETS